MKTRISIITPVHVGTGETKMRFEYKKMNNAVYNYNIEDLLSTVPDNILLGRQLLNSLASGGEGSKSKELNDKLVRNIRYQECESVYKLRYEFEYLRNKNIAVQMKSTNRPYIPGSSIKGCIMNAVYYDFVKSHLKDLYRLADTCDYKNNPFRGMDNIIELFYPKLKYKEHKGKDILSFIKQLSSCIICRDIFFNDMVIVESKRSTVYIDKTHRELVLPDAECIDEGQITIDETIIIDEDKKKLLEEVFNNMDYFKVFIKYLDENEIIRVCSQYFHDMIYEEIDMDNQNGYYTSQKFNVTLNRLFKDKINDGFYMRIGGHTNYFFKTVSYCIKKDNPKFFEKNFYQYFSPKNRPKEGKRGAYPLPNEMPSTRTVYSDGEVSYYPGVIKIEFVK